MISVETRRARLRNFQLEDVPAVHEILLLHEQDPFARFDSAWPTTREAVQEFIQTAMGLDDYIAICHRASGDVIGLALTKQSGEAEYEIGIILHPEYQRLGYSVETSRGFIDFAFRQLHAQRLTCGTAMENTPAVKLIRYLGFRPTWAGSLALRSDASGAPIEFIGVRFEMTRAEWEARQP